MDFWQKPINIMIINFVGLVLLLIKFLIGIPIGYTVILSIIFWQLIAILIIISYIILSIIIAGFMLWLNSLDNNKY